MDEVGLGHEPANGSFASCVVLGLVNAKRTLKQATPTGTVAWVLFGVQNWLWRKFGAIQIAPIKRAWRRSILARPYICRLISLSLVI
jgi:hypothetical protein